MKKIKFALLALSAAGLMSCATQQFYQVAQTKPLDQSIIKTANDNNGYFYEDQNCLIEYDFWAEKGDAGFMVFNKTDQILYILKDKTFFVKNGISHPYFEGHIWVDASYTQTMKPVQTQTQTQTVEQPLIAIAPHTRVHVGVFIIDKHIFVDCDLTRKPQKNNPATMAFTAETSPVTFGNIITYRVGDKGQEKMVEHMFYTSRVTNYQKDDLIFNENRENCANISDIKKVAVPVIRFAPPTGYYNPYVK